MKFKSLLVFLSLLFLGLNFAYGAFSEKKLIVAPQTEQTLSERMLHMTAKEYGELRGKKLNFFERLAFHSAQHQMKKSGKQSTGFNGWGFLLGFLLLPFGVLAAYIFSKDRNLRKWAWLGFGLGVVASLLLFALALASFKFR